MTTYSTVSNAEIQPGAPVASSWVTKLRDNPIAIAEGAPGAPRVVVPTALSTAETSTAKVLMPDGAGGLQWVLLPVIPNSTQAITATGSISIPVGTRVKVTCIGGGGGGGSTGSPTNGSDTTATDGTTTITGGHGKKFGGSTGTSSGGTGYSTPFDDSLVGSGGNSPGAGGDGPLGGVWGRGGACSAVPSSAGGGASARVAIFVMASGTLTITIGAGGTAGTNGTSGLAGAVIVEY